MTIEITILISVISVSFAIYSGISNIRRNRDQDTERRTSDTTSIMVKLEYISEGVNEIKSDMKNVKADILSLRERMASVESSTKSAHHRLDKLEGNSDEEK